MSERSIRQLLNSDIAIMDVDDAGLVLDALRDARADFQEIMQLGDVRADEAHGIAARRLKKWGETDE